MLGVEDGVSEMEGSEVVRYRVRDVLGCAWRLDEERLRGETPLKRYPFVDLFFSSQTPKESATAMLHDQSIFVNHFSSSYRAVILSLPAHFGS